MAKMTVIGRKKLDYVPKGQTEHVHGVHLYWTFVDSNADGCIAERIFVNASSDVYPVVMKLPLPCEVEVSFNRYGKPEWIEPLAK